MEGFGGLAAIVSEVDECASPLSSPSSSTSIALRAPTSWPLFDETSLAANSLVPAFLPASEGATPNLIPLARVHLGHALLFGLEKTLQEC